MEAEACKLNKFTGEGNAGSLGAWLYGPNDIRLLQYSPSPELGPHDVRVRMKAVGLCGSDVHFYKHMRIANYVVKEPMVLGHESAGEVVEVGSAVRRCRVGDRVALEPGRACGRCNLCKTGRYNLCPDMQFFATPPVHGSLATEVVHPEDLCFVLPDGMSVEEGAMCEPLSVAIHACNRAAAAGAQIPGATVAVVGAGPIGLVCMMTAKAFGATHVVMCDVSSDRLEMAKRLGADACVLVAAGSGTGGGAVEGSAAGQLATEEGEDATVREMLHHVRGRRVEVAFDCVGRASTMRIALKTASPGGKLVQVGMAEDVMTLPVASAAAMREVDILGIFRYRNTYEQAVELIHTKKVDVLPLITHRFPFTEEAVREAFRCSEAGGKAVKVMVIL